MISPAAALRAMRPVKSYTCAHCGRGFTASDQRARYCSNRCRQAAKYQRMKTAKAITKEAMTAPTVITIQHRR